MSIDVDHQVPREGYGQFNSKTCWYAAYRMLYAWKKQDESKIKSKLVKAGLAWDELVRRGLLMSEYRAAASLVGYGWRGSWVAEQSEGMLAHVLKQYGPLWAAMNWRGDQAAGHAVVIVGYNSKTNVFKVHNPYNRFEPGNVELEWLKASAIKDWIHDTRFALQAWG